MKLAQELMIPYIAVFEKGTRKDNFNQRAEL